MRTKLILAALSATLLPPVPSARADISCLGRFAPGVPGGITYAEGKTRAGQPCEIGFGLRGANVETLRIIARPVHGVLGVSKKEGNRRYIAYAPVAGFVGRDRFEVYVEYTPPGRATLATRMKVEMNVTP